MRRRKYKAFRRGLVRGGTAAQRRRRHPPAERIAEAGFFSVWRRARPFALTLPPNALKRQLWRPRARRGPRPRALAASSTGARSEESARWLRCTSAAWPTS